MSSGKSILNNLRDGKCPNDCGQIVLFEKPITIVPPEDVTDLIMEHQRTHDYPLRCITLVVAACPKCGYAVVNEVTEKQAFGDKK